jgi:diacylglycerol O-acyltransferase
MERLTGLDATFLYLENPTNHMHVAMTMVVDPSTMAGGYSFDEVKAFIGSRLHLVPPFRRRLVEVPFNLHHPVWVEDPDFDLDYHIRRVGAPSPGGRRELAELAGQIASNQLDRSKPLWELWVIEGLKHGRVGVVTKVHHSAIDGASGADLMVNLFDLEPSPGDSSPAPGPLPAEHIPNDLELLSYAAASRARRMMTLPSLVRSTVESVSRIAAGRRSPEHKVGAAPLTAPRTPWNASVTAHRGVGFARVALDDVKTIKNAFGTTVNDVVLAVCAGTLRRYLLSLDELPDEPLIAVCPISVRADEQGAPGNQVSAMFTSLATDVEDPADRLRAIHEITKGAKEEHNAVGADTLQNWAEFAGPNTFNLASRLYAASSWADTHRPIHNVIISNVPGPPFPLYYAGAELVAAYPMGPVMEGAGLNITVFSYRDTVDFGFMVCRELVPDIWLMAGAVDEACDELLAAAAAITSAEQSTTTKKKTKARAPKKRKPAPA